MYGDIVTRIVMAYNYAKETHTNNKPTDTVG